MRVLLGTACGDQPADTRSGPAPTASATVVTASTDYACFHTEPRCLRPTRQWTVHVLVT